MAAPVLDLPQQQQLRMLTSCHDIQPSVLVVMQLDLFETVCTHHFPFLTENLLDLHVSAGDE